MCVHLQIIMKVFLLFFLPGVCHLRMEPVSVMEGELVALNCQNVENETLWKSEAGQIYLHNMTAAEQKRRDLRLYGKHLVILRASRSHEGTYSCSSRESSRQSWFKLKVSRENKKYPIKCFQEESCKLVCPKNNIPPEDALESTSTIWHKPDGGHEHSSELYISSENEPNGVNYTCIRSYRYHRQMYNMTFITEVTIYPKERKKHAEITKPNDKEVFYVDIGAPKVIHCEVVEYSDLLDELHWLKVNQNDSLPVFYNMTWDEDEKKMTASLVFRKVSEQDLTKTYTCKFESSHQYSSTVNITLCRKASPSYFSLGVCSICSVCVVAITVVVYATFKVDVTLFLRDTLGCHRSASDGKSYDVFLMSYKSETEEELNSLDRKMLECVLEERFGYSLCLFDRDVLPGQSIADAVLDCVEQSRTVLFVPTSPDPDLESGLLSTLHAAFVERQTHLVFITTEKTGVLSTGSIPEALQLLSKAGDHVTWKGSSSVIPSSAFWKQLRYYLPAPHRPPKSKLLPQTVQYL